MLNLTFGEQVKIILSRKGMTIKELAGIIEKRTNKKMSRQNLTQRLGRDNFQEQDMRMIADILGCPFQLSILGEADTAEKTTVAGESMPTEKELSKLAGIKEIKQKKAVEPPKVTETERDITIGELVDIHKELDEMLKDEKYKAALESNMPGNNEVPGEHADAMEDSAEDAGDSDAERGAEAEESWADSGYSSAAEDMEREPEAYETVADSEGSAEAESMKFKSEEPKKKAKGWLAYFQRITHRDEEEKAVAKPEGKELHAEMASHEEADLVPAMEPAAEVEPELDLEVDAELEDDYIDYDSRRFTASSSEEDYDEEFDEEDGGLAGDDAAAVEAEEYQDDDEEDLARGELNPYTGHEFQTNSVRVHPKRIGYVQVYDRGEHRWTDMTEWAFLGYQERKKALLGADYEEPIYLD